MKPPDAIWGVVPDVPRWVEARGILLAGCGQVFGDRSGWIIRNDRPHGTLLVIVGRPAPELIREAFFDRAKREILCAVEEQAHVAGALGETVAERVLLYQLPDRSKLPAVSERVRLLSPADSLGHIEPGLRSEIEDAAKSGWRVHAAFHQGSAASFAYACWLTEGQFDISIDTVPEAQRRGLARLAATSLISDQLSQGRQPVWGALHSNLASQALAVSLGFVKVDEIVSLKSSVAGSSVPSLDP
ncbi:MAG: GNAT family N-acetyltransferase [Deltaproteobacteria bacterium]|nr:GNAT family N-acetyltransferase [Deltaproteobacteria bacterium]